MCSALLFAFLVGFEDETIRFLRPVCRIPINLRWQFGKDVPTVNSQRNRQKQHKIKGNPPSKLEVSIALMATSASMNLEKTKRFDQRAGLATQFPAFAKVAPAGPAALPFPALRIQWRLRIGAQVFSTVFAHNVRRRSRGTLIRMFVHIANFVLL